MSDKVTGAHMDERFDALEEKIQRVDSKLDANATAAEARFRVLESRLPGHSEDQIIELIDARLQAVLTPMLREAVADELRHPLKLVEEAIRSSRANHSAIETLQADVTAVKASTTPIVEIADGIRFIRRSIVTIGITAAAMSGIWALVTQVVS